jgi:hypothetical protein
MWNSGTRASGADESCLNLRSEPVDCHVDVNCDSDQLSQWSVHGRYVSATFKDVFGPEKWNFADGRLDVCEFLLGEVQGGPVQIQTQLRKVLPGAGPETEPAGPLYFASMLPTLGTDFGFAHDGDADRLVMVD